MKRFGTLFGVSLLALMLSGCSLWKDWTTVRSQSPEEERAVESNVRLVGDLAVPWGLFPWNVTGVGLVTGLPGTGSDPDLSPQRAVLLREMQKRGVDKPNHWLASETTSMVLVRGILPPGIQKGERFDVEIRVPSRSETTSLRGGRLLETRLREQRVLSDQRIHEGSVLAQATGPVLVDPLANGAKDRIEVCRGRILGGGICRESREMGLVLKRDHQNVFNAKLVANAVNRRFYTYHKGVKQEVAKPINDQYIKLEVYPRYKDNVERYVRVVRAIALRETAKQRVERLALLERQLFDPVTAQTAALRLEALGPQGAEVLRKGIESDDAEIRFFAAEALAYLDDPAAAEPLGRAARENPAFRVFALAALSAMDEFAARQQLRELLEVDSAETRYGAFRALWTMSPNGPQVLGENLGGQFSYHVLNTSGTPMIHATRSRRPEIVLFGADQRLNTPLALEVGKEILITSRESGKITVSKFSLTDPDEKRHVSDSVDEVIRAIAELGGTYPDVVQALQQAKTSGALSSRFAIEALPEAGRTYTRSSSVAEKRSWTDGPRKLIESIPRLFSKETPPTKGREEPPEDASASVSEPGPRQ